MQLPDNPYVAGSVTIKIVAGITPLARVAMLVMQIFMHYFLRHKNPSVLAGEVLILHDRQNRRNCSM